jgi:hypothetical protein
MKQSDSNLILLEFVNSIRVKKSDLLSVIRDTANFRQRGKHCRFVVAGIGRGNSDKAAAIMIRLQALARMADTGDLCPWIVANDPGCSPSVAYRALTSAAMQHPLSLIDGDFIFEKESFLRSVLELAKPAGLLQ